MAIKSKFPDRLQLRLTSSVELIRASLEPYMAWIEKMIGAPLDQTLTLEVDAVPATPSPSASCLGFRCRQEPRLEIALGTV
jgi:hypothetical protein